MRSGFVSLIGRPNVGKSTLLNALINEKIAITSDKAGTTRNVIQGIYNEKDYQIVFVDTPGIAKPINRLGRVLNKKAREMVDDVDAILFVIDGKKGIGPGDKYILNMLKTVELPVILVINKIDQISDEILLYTINEYKDLYEFAEIIPVSALNNDNVDRLIKVLKEYLPDNVKYFPGNETTTAEMDFRLSEIVREKIFIHTNEEVPHSISCKLSGYEEKNNIAYIYIDIIVDRDSLRKIIVGANGNMIKTIGHEARLDMEKILGKKVYLELYCKTIKKWREKDKYIKDLGYLLKDE